MEVDVPCFQQPVYYLNGFSKAAVFVVERKAERIVFEFVIPGTNTEN